jgi:hypothetical protein
MAANARTATFPVFFGNPTGVARPETDSPAGVARWLQQLIEHCVTERQSAIVDLGGGDTTLRTLATEMPGLAAAMEAAGVAPVMLYLLGTQAEDLTPALTLSARGFAPKAQALVLNEVAIDAGTTRAGAFGRMTCLPGFIELAKTSVPVWMPRLFAAEAIKARQCRFLDARDGKVTPPLGMFDAARLRAWLDAMDRRLAGIIPGAGSPDSRRPDHLSKKAQLFRSPKSRDFRRLVSARGYRNHDGAPASPAREAGCGDRCDAPRRIRGRAER